MVMPHASAEAEFARLLLVLDLDETLVHAVAEPLSRPCDFRVGPFYIYKRPYVDFFLAKMSSVCDLAVWSAGSSGYVEPTVSTLFRLLNAPKFVWSRARCTVRFDPDRYEEYCLKNLKKVRRLGFDLRRTIIVEDEPRKVARHYGNAVYVSEFTGDAADRELLWLADYLQWLVGAGNVRCLEKRNWRGHHSVAHP
jgi:TFIIF-interacting CTD phosphatase-like protein